MLSAIPQRKIMPRDRRMAPTWNDFRRDVQCYEGVRGTVGAPPWPRTLVLSKDCRSRLVVPAAGAGKKSQTIDRCGDLPRFRKATVPLDFHDRTHIYALGSAVQFVSGFFTSGAYVVFVSSAIGMYVVSTEHC